jgi:hypothetical protein
VVIPVICGKTERMISKSEYCTSVNDAVGVPLPFRPHDNPGATWPGGGYLHPEEAGTFATVELINNIAGDLGIDHSSLHQEKRILLLHMRSGTKGACKKSGAFKIL